MVDENLPLGWARLALNQLCIQASEKVSPSDVAGLPYIGLEHIERDTHRLRGHGTASDTTSVKSVFRAGEVLYGRLRPNLNKVVVASFDGICSTDIIVLRPTRLIEAYYLLQILSTPDFLEYAISRAKGINLPRLSAQSIMAYACPVPPIQEQVRILNALGSHLDSLHIIQERLDAVQRLVAILPPKILAAATHGHLTEPWRARQGAKVTDLATTPSRGGGVFADGAGTLPTGWKSQAVEDVGTVKKGRVRSPEYHHGSNMRPYLRVANVLEDRIDVSDVMTMNFTPEEFERFRLRSGDILLNEGQSLELVGRPAMFRGELDDVCFTNSLIQFRCGSAVLPDFAILVLRHYLHAGVFSQVANITTNLAHLGALRFAALQFPVPPIIEQTEIVKIGRNHLERTEQLSARLKNTFAMLASLQALIRVRALSGKLVEQAASEQPVAEAMQSLILASVPQSHRLVIPRKKATAMKTVISVKDALDQASRALSARELFSAAGYPDDASSELVERFYLDLRQQLIDGRVERKELKGADVFDLSEGSL